MPRLDIHVQTSEMKNPFASRNQVLRPVASHALAGQDEQTVAIRDNQDRYVGMFASVSAVRRQRDLLLTGCGFDHRLGKSAHLRCNHTRPAAIPFGQAEMH